MFSTCRRIGPCFLLLISNTATAGTGIVRLRVRPNNIAPFTDDPLVPGTTPIRLVHLLELRTAIDNIRQQAAGLPAFAWTDPQPTTIRAIHVVELRTALTEALTKLGRSVPSWTPGAVSGGVVLAAHFQGIRDAARGIVPTDVGGAINGNVTWSAAGSPYVVQNDITVMPSASLTIAPGTVVKFAAGRSLLVAGGGTLIANGTTNQPIYFTSIKDDAVGGDTNQDGNSTTPASGDWLTLGIGSDGQTAYGSVTNVVVRYGAQLMIRWSAPTLRNLTSTNMSGDGLYLEAPPSSPYTIEKLTLTDNERNLNLKAVPSGTTIRDSVIRRAKTMAVQATNGTAANVSNNAIEDNHGGPPITLDGSSPLVLRYNSVTNNRTTDGNALGVQAACCATVDALYNWWGSTTGPNVAGQSSTTTGGGSQVSSYVQFDPWLGQPWEFSFKVGEHPWTLKAGVGTDVATGNFHLVERDISIPTIGFPLEIVRTYNNKNSGPIVNDFGNAWTWNYGAFLAINPLDYGVVWNRDDGAQIYFKQNPDNTFSSEEGIYENLIWDPSSSTYRMTRKDQSVFVFSSGGKLVSEIDPNGNITSITRDSSGRVLRVTEPLGRALNFEYDGQYISRITDPLGRSISYTRHSNGAIQTVTKRDQFGATFATATYSYGTNGVSEMTGFIDFDGNQLSQTFDPLFLQNVATQQFNGLAQITFSYNDPVQYATSVRDTHGRLHVYYYNRANKVLLHQHEQPNGSFNVKDQWTYTGYLVSAYTNLDGTTTSTYDWSTGNLTQLTEPGGRTTTYTYDQFNNVTSRRDNLGRITQYAYDTHMNLLRETDVLGEITQHEYFSTGLKMADTDALGHRTSFEYDSYGYPLTITNAATETTRFEYDVAGRKTAETDPLNHRTVYTYNGRDQVLDVTDPLGNRTSYTYDMYGRKTSMTDAESHTTTYTYNSHNLLWRTVDARNGVVELQYDDTIGNLIKVIDPNYHATTFSYDDLDRKVTETDGLNRTWRYEYVGTNRLSRVIDAAGVSTYRYYDAFNQLSQVKFSDNSTVTYTYDGVGNTTSMTDWTSTTTWAYDQLNRIINVNKGNPDTAYGYDAAGNLSWIRAEAQKPVSYTYDDANRLKTVTDWSGRTTSYSYDKAGRVMGCVYPNGVTATRTYDDATRLVTIAYAKGSTVLASADYSVNRVGNRIWKRDQLGQYESYGYDELNRLYWVSYPGSQSVLYGYDSAGNRTALTPYTNGVPGTTVYYYYDAANQAVNDARGSCAYDADGALIASGSRSLSWNPQHRLQALSDSGLSESWVYDGEGRRVRQTVNGSVTSFVVDSRPSLSRVLLETTNGATTEYVYGLELLYTVESGTPHYVHTDGLGSVTLGTDASGQWETSATYDIFGWLTGVAGNWPRREFTGEEADTRTSHQSLLYLRSRYYDSVTGRFLSPDIFPSVSTDTQAYNRYAYAADNPVNKIDPTGEYAVLDDALLFAIGAAGGVLGHGISDLITWRRCSLSDS